MVRATSTAGTRASTSAVAVVTSSVLAERATQRSPSSVTTVSAPVNRTTPASHSASSSASRGDGGPLARWLNRFIHQPLTSSRADRSVSRPARTSPAIVPWQNSKAVKTAWSALCAGSAARARSART
ncbi:hypothetical protein ACFQX8_23460 [Klenkia terrae]|uniref:hypothetical protein n=1 Tax=Klenkia terrae TaxID=1052259 RepID=UPI003608F540